MFPAPPDITGSVRFYIDYDDFMNSLNGKCTVKTDPLPPEIIGFETSPHVFDCVVNERI